jgi:hypothetical protein
MCRSNCIRAAGRIGATFILLVATHLMIACRSECDFVVAKGDWTYQGRRQVTWRGTFCRFELAHKGQRVLGNNVVITPLGTFKVMMQSEHGDSDSGWKRVSDTTSDQIAATGPPITDADRAAGYYMSHNGTKRAGTPPEWVFMGGVFEPGWVHPTKLSDVHFLKLHPAEKQADPTR